MNHEKLERARMQFEALKAREAEAAAALKHANEMLVMISYTLESWRRSMPPIGRFPALEEADKQAIRQLPDLLDNPAEFARIVAKYEIDSARGIAEQLVATHSKIDLATRLREEAKRDKESMQRWFGPVDHFARSLGY